MTYNMEPLYLVPFIFSIVGAFAIPNYRKVLLINSAYFIVEWINHHYLHFEIERLISYGDLYTILTRLLAFTLVIIWKYTNIDIVKYPALVAFIAWFGRFVYEKIMIEANSDMIEYDGSGNKVIISRPWYLFIGLMMLVLGIILKKLQYFDPAGIIFIILSVPMILYNIYKVVYGSDYLKYNIRNRASYGEYHERKDIDSNIYL